MKIKEKEHTLTVYLSGELDHHAAKPMREETDEALLLYKPKTLLLDFSGVSFMDSSGVGFVMGRYKKAAALGCKTAVSGLTKKQERIMRFSGLPQLVEFLDLPIESSEKKKGFKNTNQEKKNEKKQ